MNETTSPEREAFLAAFPVSQETIHRLETYSELLQEWQGRMNLVAASTLPHIWQRHFHDSAQLFPLIPSIAKTLVDVGSGAGFPGMVLAIMAAAAKPDLTVHLIEATQKKAGFLRHIATTLALPVVVHADRAEAIKGVVADVITARAVTELAALFRLTQPFTLNGWRTTCLFLKGERAAAEINAARAHWQFECHITTSQTDPRGQLLRIEGLSYKAERGNNSKLLSL
jgi:16S rRNA (guanine527-N7)-methyltransferase